MDSDDSVQRMSVWFRKEIWLPRLTAVSVFYFVLTVYSTLFSIALMQLTLFHPVVSLIDAARAVFTVKYWLIALLSGFLSVPLIGLMSQIVTVRNEKWRTLIFSSSNSFGWTVGYFVSHVLVEFVVVWCCLVMVVDDRRMIPVILYGTISASVISCMNYFRTRRYCLEYVPDSEFGGMKKRFIALYRRILQRGRAANKFFAYSCLISFISLTICAWRINRAFGLPVTSLLQTLYHVLLLKPFISWAVLICIALINFRRMLSEILLNIFLYEPYEFILPTSDLLPLGQEKELTPLLAEALSSDNQMVKYLGFWDLKRLSSQRQPRLQRLFSVSHPGGHPRSWASLSTVMLNNLETATKIFHEINERLVAAWEFQIQHSITDSGVAFAQPKHWNPSWTLQQQQMAKQNDFFETGEPQHAVKTKSPVRRQYSIGLPKFATGLWRVNSSKIDHYSVWGDLQLYLWNIEATSHIIVASYTDDKYGIIQRDLAKFLGAVVDIISASDRYGRLISSQKLSQNQLTEIDINMTQLRSILSASLSRIAATFGENLNPVRLNEQQRKILRRFVG